MAQPERKETIDPLTESLNKGLKRYRDRFTERTNKQTTVAFDKYSTRSYLLVKTPAKQKAVITEGTEVTGNQKQKLTLVPKQMIMSSTLDVLLV